MRAVVTLLLAFILSLLAGGVVATQIAIATAARDEFILVFAFVPLLAALTAFAFGVALMRGDRARRVAWTGGALTALIATLVLGVAGYAFASAAGEFATARRDWPVLLGLAAPSLATVVTQWLFVGWRLRAAAGVVNKS